MSLAPLPLDKNAPRWLYESFRRIELELNKNKTQLAAVDRGELPTGGGTPITTELDLSQYFFLPGRVGGQVGFGSNSQSVPTGNGVVFQGFNLFTPSNATNNAGRIELKQDCTFRIANLRMVERDSTYTKGINVAFGINFATITFDGTLRLTPAGSTEKFLLVETSSVDTAYGANKDDTVFRRLVSRTTGNFVIFGHVPTSISNIVTTLSSIRKSDGAWVGPIVASGTDTHIDNIFQILDDLDNTKILTFQVGNISTGTIRQLTAPDWNGIIVAPAGLGNPTQVPMSQGSSQLIWANVEHSDTTDRTTFSVSCTANGTTALISAGLFGNVQVGHVIYGSGVPAGTTVTVVTDPSNITVSASVTAGAEPITRNFASDDHIQLIRVFGPTGQYIGVKPAVGTVAAGALHISTALSVGTTLPAGGTRDLLHVEKDYTGVNAGTALLVIFKLSNTGTGTVNTTQRTVTITNSGAGSRTAGSPTTVGIDITVNPSCPTGLTEGNVLGINMVAKPSGAIGATVPLVTGCNAECGAAAAITVTQMTAATYTMTPISATVGTMIGIEILCSSTSQQTGTVTNAIGLQLDSFVSAGTITGAGAVTNWYGISRQNALPAAVTNKWFIYLLADIPSIHVGRLRIGSNATPTHILELAAGTTTKAPFLLTSGTSLATPIAGAIEFTTDDFFATITTGAARKAFILDDGSRLTLGRIPFATTNGRLIDSSHFTFSDPGSFIVGNTNVVTFNLQAQNNTRTNTIVDDLSAVSGAASGIITTFRINNTGTLGYSSGAFTNRGFTSLSDIIVPNGVTVSNNEGALFQSSPTFTGTGQINGIVGIRIVSQGPTSSITGTANFSGIEIGISINAFSSNNFFGIRLYDAGGSDSGSFTNGYGIHIGSMGFGTGTVTNWYGLKIDSPTGTFGTKWGIVVQGDVNRLEGKLRLGDSSTPTEQFEIVDAGNIKFGTGTGTKIGTATSQKLSLWNATPIVQPTTGIAAATFVTNTSLIANDTATFDGYTLGQVVKALRNVGILA